MSDRRNLVDDGGIVSGDTLISRTARIVNVRCVTVCDVVAEDEAGRTIVVAESVSESEARDTVADMQGGCE